MTANDTTWTLPLPARPAFADGDRLTASDLGGATDYAEALRWLHARALHDWGISLGLDVTGAAGESTVVVEVGYAVDRLGREVIVGASTGLPVPAVSGGLNGAPMDWFLTASYPDAPPGPAERRGTALGAAGAARRSMDAVLRWREQDPALGDRRGLDLVLAQVSVAGCRLQTGVSATGRRDRIPGGTPYISAGTTPPGATKWQTWQIGEARPGVLTTVSTIEAGFRSVPFYQVQLVGERVLTTAVGGAPLDVLIDGSAYVTAGTATSFVLRVALQGLTSLGVSRSDVVAAEDLEAVLGRFSVPLLALYSYYQNNRNNPRTSLSTGDGLVTYAATADGNYTSVGQHVITQDDMHAGFDHFAQRHAISVDELGRQNNLDLSGSSPLSLRLGQQLVVSRGTTPVNPVQVTSQPGFLDELTTTLGWHVTWLGVER